MTPIRSRVNGLVSARQVAGAVGAFRTVVGPALLARPEVMARMLGVDGVTAARTRWLARMLASRELAIGLGTSFAVATGRSVRPWLLVNAVCDAGDVVAAVLAARARQVSGPRALGLGVFTLAGVVGQLVSALPADDGQADPIVEPDRAGTARARG